MRLGKRVVDAFKFLFTNPLIFLVYLPITLLGLLSVYVDFTTTLNSVLAVLYMAVMLSLTSFVFAFIILKTAYYESNKKVTFKQNFSVSKGKFLPLLLAEFIMILAVIIISTLINFVSLIWTTNLGIAVSIVLAILFIALLVKLLLFAPSSVLKGGLGFGESWKLEKLKRFFELLLLVVAYSLISFGLSYVPYAGYLIDSLVFGPVLMIIITMLYLDYLKK